MPTTQTTNKELYQPEVGGEIGTWGGLLNNDFLYIDDALGSSAALDATAGDATLTIGTYRNLILDVTGAISADVTYTIPSGVGGMWIVRNATTDATGGPWTITFESGGGGTVIVVPRTVQVLIYSNGTDIRQVGFIVTSNEIDNGAVTYPKLATSALANASDFSSDAADKIIPVATVWDAAGYFAVSYAASVALDLNTGSNFSMTQTGDLTLANPTNAKPGQSGVIALTQDGTGNRNVSFGSYFKFANGEPPIIDGEPGRVNMVLYTVVTSSFIVTSVLAGVR